MRQPVFYPDGTVVTFSKKPRKQIPLDTRFAITEDGEVTTLLGDNRLPVWDTHRYSRDYITGTYCIGRRRYTILELVYITWIGSLKNTQSVDLIDPDRPISTENLKIVNWYEVRDSIVGGTYAKVIVERYAYNPVTKEKTYVDKMTDYVGEVCKAFELDANNVRTALRKGGYAGKFSYRAFHQPNYRYTLQYIFED